MDYGRSHCEKDLQPQIPNPKAEVSYVPVVARPRRALSILFCMDGLQAVGRVHCFRFRIWVRAWDTSGQTQLEAVGGRRS